MILVYPILYNWIFICFEDWKWWIGCRLACLWIGWVFGEIADCDTGKSLWKTGTYTVLFIYVIVWIVYFYVTVIHTQHTSDTRISVLSLLCCARAVCFERQQNFVRAIHWYRSALSYDSKCQQVCTRNVWSFYINMITSWFIWIVFFFKPGHWKTDRQSDVNKCRRFDQTSLTSFYPVLYLLRVIIWTLFVQKRTC